MTEGYIQILIESLEKKLVVLDKIIELDKRQLEIATQQPFDMLVYDKSMDEKGVLIDEINRLDEGFTSTYERIKDEVQANPDKYRAFALECANVPEALADTYPTPSFTANAVPTQEQIARVNTWLVEKELLSEPYTYEQMVDDSFVQD